MGCPLTLVIGKPGTMMLILIQKPTRTATTSKKRLIAVIQVTRRWSCTFWLCERWLPQPNINGLPSRFPSKRAVCFTYLRDLLGRVCRWFGGRRVVELFIITTAFSCWNTMAHIHTLMR